MQRFHRWGLTAGCLALAACAQTAEDRRQTEAIHRPAPGSNTMLVAPLETADGLEVIVSDVFVPANQSAPFHSHPGEEFVYVIEGEAVHREEGQEDRVYTAGEAFVIRKGRVHAPKTLDQPVRAIVFRVHVVGEPEQVPAP